MRRKGKVKLEIANLYVITNMVKSKRNIVSQIRCMLQSGIFKEGAKEVKDKVLAILADCGILVDADLVEAGEKGVCEDRNNV